MTEKEQFISVIIPTCDRPKTLIQCIDSIRSNNYKEYEIIVVDQSSDSKTENLIKKYSDPDLIYIRSDIKCSSDARNRGWKKAKGDIIAFTDDDAFVDSGWLEAISEALNASNADVGMVGGRITPLFKTPRPSWLPPEKDFLLPSFDAGSEVRPFPEESLPVSVNLALRNKVLEETGGFDTRLGLKKSETSIDLTGGEDSYLGIKVKNLGYKIIYLPTAIVFHPITPDRLTKSFFLKRNFREGVTAIALENVKSTCTKKRLSSHISWHTKRIFYYFLLMVKDIIFFKENRSRIIMLRAAEIAFSIGVVRHSAYLKGNQ